MPLRLKIFLGIFLFFAVAFFFFGHTAFNSAVQSGTKREQALLQDISSSLSQDLSTDISNKPKETSLDQWLDGFKNPDLAILISDSAKSWTNGAGKVLPESIRQEIMKLAASGSKDLEDLTYIWNTSQVKGTPYSLSIVHRTKAQEGQAFVKNVIVTLIVTGLIVIWAGVWSAFFVASLIERLRHSALHDALTGLPNRTLMQDRLEMAMNIAERANAEMSLLVMDLNKFKEINDTLGHHVGDKLLIEMSSRLMKGVRKSDTVARLGGDEFAIILNQISIEDTVAIAEKLGRLIQEPMKFGDRNLVVSGSFGIARYPTHSRDPVVLMQHADVAMYVSKRSGVNHVIYNPTMDVASQENMLLVNELRNAIELKQLSLNYQPKIRIESGEVIGAEALLRWKHPKLGFVPPDRFIPLAEQSGLIGSLTVFVLDTALSDLQMLQDLGHNLTMAINLSALSLQDPELMSLLHNAVDKYHIDPTRIMLEITETAVMDKTVHATEALDAINELGFNISMDDFGTGHSSLVNLRHIPLQEIKIDRTFIMNMLSTEDDAAIVRTIIELGRSLSKVVVAEGVESEDILAELAKLGCHIAQGYHISRPMPFKDFVDWLDQYIAKRTSSNPSAAGALS